MLDWKSEIQNRLRGLRLKPEREAEILDELSSHLQDRYDELRASGLLHEDARRDVLAELDSTDLVSELRSTQQAARESVPQGAPRTGAFFSDLLLDLRYAARTLRKSPGFTAVAILTLALGIGANAAVFTVINSLILNPLPVDHISTLVALNTTQTKKVAQLGDLQLLSFPNFRDLRDRATSFVSLAAHSNPTAVTMIDKDQPHRVQMELVTSNYFDTLGLHPSQGRFFLPDEDAKPGANGRLTIPKRVPGQTDAGSEIPLRWVLIQWVTNGHVRISEVYKVGNSALRLPERSAHLVAQSQIKG